MTNIIHANEQQIPVGKSLGDFYDPTQSGMMQFPSDTILSSIQEHSVKNLLACAH